MTILTDIDNYLVVKNGEVTDHQFKQDIQIQDQKIIINEDATVQIIVESTIDHQLEIVVGKNTNVDLIEMYKASSQCSYTKNIDVESGAKVTRYVENTSTLEENVKINESLNIYRDAIINCAYVELSDYSTNCNIHYNLLEEGASAKLRLAALSKDKEKKNYEITLHHKAPNTYGDMDNYGIVKSGATLIIDGVGRIDKGQYQSSTHQTNKIIVFDEGCNAQANPYLYIDEYDVKASHGASVGKIDEDHLYYLQSRGLSKQDAMHLVTYGYFLPVLEFVSVESLKERFSSILKEKVGL